MIARPSFREVVYTAHFAGPQAVSNRHLLLCGRGHLESEPLSIRQIAGAFESRARRIAPRRRRVTTPGTRAGRHPASYRRGRENGGAG
ncbi:hypothetical protein GCM10027088_50250 [Nocardia goodfellowii]